MKRVKTWAIFLIPLLYCGQLEAATNDSFTITITVNYIGIVLQDQSAADYTTWAIGAVTGGSTNTMASNNGGVGDQGIQVVNTSNYATDIECWVSNAGSWSVGGAPGVDTFTLSAKAFDAWQAGPAPDMTAAVAITATASPGADIKTNLASATNTFLYYELGAPTEVSSPAQNTITVTVAATAH